MKKKRPDTTRNTRNTAKVAVRITKWPASFFAYTRQDLERDLKGSGSSDGDN